MKHKTTIAKLPLTFILIGCVLTLSLFLISCESSTNKETYSAEAHSGKLSLIDWDPSLHSEVKLIGDWSFIPGDLVDSFPDASSLLYLPDTWGERTIGSYFEDGQGCASFRLLISGLPRMKLALSIKQINSAFQVLLNGELVHQNGKVACQLSEASPDYSYQPLIFDNQEDELEIILQISNYHTRNIGIPTVLTLGTPKAILEASSWQTMVDAFLFGVLLIIAVYHFIIFFFRQQDKSLLYFAIASLAMAIRTLLTGEQLAYGWTPSSAYSILFKIDYLTYTMGTIFFMAYIHSIFPKEYARWQVWILTIPAIIYSCIIVLTSNNFYPQFLAYFQILTGLGLVFIVIGQIRAIYFKRENAWLFAAGFLAFVLGVANDILHYSSISLTGSDNMSVLGVFIFFIAQSVLLSFRFSRAYSQIKELSNDLQQSVDNQVQLNQAIKRFVPVQFLQELGKEGYSDIQLGDSTAKVMTVLFSDLRSFTKLSESLNPVQNFEFLNSYLKRMEPPIQSHGGFVDKYIGDAIMALFRDRENERSADAAVQTALALRQELLLFNEERSEQGRPAIDFGIGINTGELMLGTVGSENRLDTTVIGDTVNLSSRLEALTKYFGTPIILSEYTYHALSDPHEIPLRKIDLVRVPGKEKAITIYELISKENPELADRKQASLLNFYQAIDWYSQGRFKDALQIFKQILRFNPMDKVVDQYRTRCEYFIEHPPQKDWDRALEISRTGW
ncbi:MAG: adenylate/guanylate cyclase domain-containing protein [Saprospiraceae bacterium]|nr:adenylate/guanylate cyclase domain-containing protein [Saprospiraceae bacterium]